MKFKVGDVIYNKDFKRYRTVLGYYVVNGERVYELTSSIGEYLELTTDYVNTKYVLVPKDSLEYALNCETK